MPLAKFPCIRVFGLWQVTALFLMVSGLSGPAAGSAQAAGPQEYQVKAAMVVNMAKFVEWPAEVLPVNTPLRVCLAGGGPFGPALDSFKGRSVKGNPLNISQVTTGDDLGGCHILVIGSSDRRHQATLLAAARQAGLLTVSDTPRFTQTGGMIGFVENGGTIRFEVNVAAAQRSRLRISSQLLKLARIVREGDP